MPRGILLLKAAHRWPMRGAVTTPNRSVHGTCSGWHGTADLGDFWRYDLNSNMWTQLSPQADLDGGPSPRSCHKMCINSSLGHIYALGRYIDGKCSVHHKQKSDFYRYDIKSGAWTQLSADTATSGGPSLIYDHQMCMSEADNTVYVFGGRVVCDSDEQVYGGLYSYNCVTATWRLLRSDCDFGADYVKLRSRKGHSMLLDENENTLYFFAGQRVKDYMSDLFKYSIATGELTEISRDTSKQGGPHPGFTQRSTIDPQQREFYVLSGLMRENNSQKRKADADVDNSLWVYNIARRAWYCAYTNKNVDPEYWADPSRQEPCPRYAHQLVSITAPGLQCGILVLRAELTLL